MEIRNLFWVVCLTLGQFATAQPAPTKAKADGSKLPLAEDWSLQSSSKVDQSGEIISKASYQPKNWYRVTVPTTVVRTVTRYQFLGW